MIHLETWAKSENSVVFGRHKESLESSWRTPGEERIFMDFETLLCQNKAIFNFIFNVFERQRKKRRKE